MNLQPNKNNLSMENFPLAKIAKCFKEFAVLKNKSRQEFGAQMIGGMIKQRSVQYSEIAQGIDSEAKVESTERRIEDWFCKVKLDYEALMVLLTCFIPGNFKKWTLSIDRTEWDFGRLQINILCAIVQIGKIGVPLYFEMLDNNSGNSNWEQRIDLLKTIVKEIGKYHLEMVVMDREFIGQRWLSWLKKEKIGFCVRVPKNHKLILQSLEERTAEQLVQKRRTCRLKNVVVDGVVVNAWVERLANGDFLYLIGTVEPQKLPRVYRRRWSIEVFFQAIKNRGFNLEESHIKTFERMRKLFALVCIAYAICWASTWAYKREKGDLKKKNHGYPQYSDFRFGLNQVRNYLKTKANRFVEQVLELINDHLHLRFDKIIG